jgi:CRP/FNR family transcriptional regulator, cyclic AMP receptor protein
MAIHSLEDILEQHPFLSDLNPEHMELITGCAANRTFDPDEYLAREGEEANSFYLVRSGTVAVELRTSSQNTVRVTTVSDGEILGWSWLVEPHRWRFDARAVTPVRAFALDGACLRRKTQTDHEFGYQLLRRFAALIQQRLEAACLQLADMYGQPRR